MTSALTPAEVLRELLELACAPSGETDAATLGTPTAPRWTRHAVRIEPTRYHDVRAIDYRPWTVSEFGEMEIHLADAADWRVADLEPSIGPFRELPLRHGRADRAQGIFERHDLPSWAAVYVDLDGPLDGTDRRVTHISIRLEPQDDEPTAPDASA